MRLNGSEEKRSRFSSWCRGDSDRVATEIRTRQMYGQNHGIDFDSQTVVMKGTKRQFCDSIQERTSDIIKSTMDYSQPRKSSQSTMGLFGGSNGSTSKKSCGNGFFDKILRDIDADEKPKKQCSPSWIKGIGGDVPKDKRMSIERSLKWMEERFDEKVVAPNMHQPELPVDGLPMIGAPADVAGVNGQIYEGNGKTFEGNGKADVAKEMIYISASMSKAVESDVFMSLRSRIGTLLLQDLPEPVTAELRQMGKELEELSLNMKQI
ncbi:MAG: hypothetical protein KKD39_02900 [Candidatus Altiarchaeota archaeon]|nr:hypothetical protein [Candidatus Altiarchaeota archaeon]